MIGLRIFRSNQHTFISGAGTRDEPLRISAAEAKYYDISSLRYKRFRLCKKF